MTCRCVLFVVMLPLFLPPETNQLFTHLARTHPSPKMMLKLVALALVLSVVSGAPGGGSLDAHVDDEYVDDVDDAAERQAECAMRRLIFIGPVCFQSKWSRAEFQIVYQFISVTILFFTIRYNCYELSI